MTASSLVTELCHEDIFRRQTDGFVRSPANMSLVEDIRPFRVMFLHLALCRYCVHKVLVSNISDQFNVEGTG